MPAPGEEILLEWRSGGNSLQVQAVDAADGLEVSFIAPVSASRRELERLAVAKLNFVRRRQAEKRGGIIV